MLMCVFELTNMNAVQFYVHTAIYNSDMSGSIFHISTYGFGLLNMTDTWSHYLHTVQC